jgi:hypothetical protein
MNEAAAKFGGFLLLVRVAPTLRDEANKDATRLQVFGSNTLPMLLASRQEVQRSLGRTLRPFSSKRIRGIASLLRCRQRGRQISESCRLIVRLPTSCRANQLDLGVGGLGGWRWSQQ